MGYPMPPADAVKDAIHREETLGEFLLERYRSKLDRFEEEHGMSTEAFRERFQQGELGDDEDFFEWMAVSEAVDHWEGKLADLKAAG